MMHEIIGEYTKMNKKVKFSICMLLAMVIIATTFMTNNVTVEAAKPKNTTYYVDCSGVKSLKKSNGKLIVTAKSKNPLAYDTSKGVRTTKKITYKLAKKCKWSISDPEESYYSKTSYTKIKKMVKYLDAESVLTIKIKSGKIVRVNISSP